MCFTGFSCVLQEVIVLNAGPPRNVSGSKGKAPPPGGTSFKFILPKATVSKSPAMPANTPSPSRSAFRPIAPKIPNTTSAPIKTITAASSAGAATPVYTTMYRLQAGQAPAPGPTVGGEKQHSSRVTHSPSSQPLQARWLTSSTSPAHSSHAMKSSVQVLAGPSSSSSSTQQALIQSGNRVVKLDLATNQAGGVSKHSAPQLPHHHHHQQQRHHSSSSSHQSFSYMCESGKDALLKRSYLQGLFNRFYDNFMKSLKPSPAVRVRHRFVSLANFKSISKSHASSSPKHQRSSLQPTMALRGASSSLPRQYTIVSHSVSQGSKSAHGHTVQGHSQPAHTSPLHSSRLAAKLSSPKVSQPAVLSPHRSTASVTKGPVYLTGTPAVYSHAATSKQNLPGRRQQQTSRAAMAAAVASPGFNKTLSMRVLPQRAVQPQRRPEPAPNQPAIGGGQSPAGDRHTCIGCQQPAHLVCSACEKVWYCSRQCQVGYFCDGNLTPLTKM